MMRPCLLILTFAFLIISAYGCSGIGGGSPTSPHNTPETTAVETAGTTSCLGLWQVIINKDAGTIQAVDMRSSDLIINVLGFLEPPPLSGMTIDFTTLIFADPIVEVDVIITHPLPDPLFMGFDVRGVVFGPNLKNADGWTVIPSPEFFKGVPFGYKDGLLGTPDSYVHYTGLAGYRYFCDDLAKDADLAAFMSNPANLAYRGVFSPNPKKNRRHYILDWSNGSPSFMIFNYAIYANYNWPSGTAPFDINDFDISTANSAEAFCAKVTEVANSLYYSTAGGGGAISLDVEVWDWQGDIANVTIESIPSGVIALTPYTSASPGTTSHSYKYSFVNIPGVPTATGDLGILITVTDSKKFGEAWLMGLLPATNAMYDKPVYNCFKHATKVVDCPPPLITGMAPDNAWAGQLLSATITCSFIDGPSLAVKLKSGATNIAGVITGKDAVAGWIKANFTLPEFMTAGLWDLVVTNGCGTDGTKTNAFTAKGCPKTMGLPGTPIVMGTYDSSPKYRYYSQCGHVTSRLSKTPYIISGNYHSHDDGKTYYYTLSAYPLGPGGTAPAFTLEPDIFNVNEIIRSVAITSNDKVYFLGGANAPTTYQLYSADFTPTGFTNIAKQEIKVGLAGMHVCVDPNDNPIVLAYNAMTAPVHLYVYHWNGLSWNTITLPDSILAEHKDDQFATAHDFDFEPVMGNYLIVDSSFSTDQGSPHLYAFNQKGTLVWVVNPVWSGWFITGQKQPFYMGIYVDQKSPDCRILVSGCTSYLLGPKANRYAFARFNPLGKEEVSVTGDGQWCFQDLLYGSMRGTVAYSGNSYYYYDEMNKATMANSPIAPW